MVKKKFKSAAEILAIDDLKTEVVHIPEWDTSVYIRALNGTERDQFEIDSLKRKGKDIEANMENLRARLVSLTATDEKGERFFEDATKLGKKNAFALDRLFNVARKLSGIGNAEVEELTGN